MGDDPRREHTAEQLWVERTCAARLEGDMRPRSLWRYSKPALTSRESSILELRRGIRGFRFSIDAMWDETSRLNLFELAPALEMPVFFFLGRKDHFVPPEASLPYIEVLKAPSKKLVWFEEFGHEPFVDEPDKFNASMVELVRSPLSPDLLARAA